MPKRFTVLLALAGILLAVALPQAADAPSAIIPRAPLAATVAPQSPTAPGATKTPVTGTPPAKHTVTMKFDYDFSRSPVCSVSLTTNCVQQFNVYDVSGGPAHHIKLFSIPVPPDARGQMKGITGTSPQLSWEPGTHFLAVTAQPVTGDESNPAFCMTTVQINP